MSSYGDYPLRIYARVLKTNEEALIANISLNESIDLKNIVVTCFIKGPILSTINARINLYSKPTLSALLASSDWFELTTETLNNYSNNYYGNLRFDFNGYPLNAGFIYYLTIETDNYVRIKNEFYLSVDLETSLPFYNHIDDVPGARLKIVGLK